MRDATFNPSQLLAALIPVGLWAALWLGVGGGNASDILTPSNRLDFLNGMRSILPFVAAGLALVTCIARWIGQRPPRMLYWGPLGLAAVYGIVGTTATLLSPDGSNAIYWGALYLSVPLVLWSIVWSANPLSHLYRLINLTWVALVLVTGVLFAIALVYMDLGDVIRNPSGFFRCDNAGHWFDQTSGLLRSTGVGRYAALTAIVAFVGLWRGRFYWLWGPILLLSLMLLMTTGARTAMLGLGASVGLVVLIYGGKRAVLGGVLVLAVIIPLHFVTDFGQESLDKCFLHKGTATITEEVKVTEPVAPESSLVAQSELESSQSSETLAAIQPSPEPTSENGPSPNLKEPVESTLAPAPTPISEAPLVQTGTSDPSPTERIPTERAKESRSKVSVQTDHTLGPENPLVAETPLVQIGTPTSSPPYQVPTEPSMDSDSKVAARIELTPVPETSMIVEAPLVQTGTSASSPTGRVPTEIFTSSGSLVPVQSESDSSLPGVNQTVLKPPTLPSHTPVVRSYITTVTVENKFVNLSGRTRVWEASLELIKDSPIIGRGFNADRLMLNTHVHNAYLQALMQSGVLGTIPFVAALVIAWVLLFKTLRNMTGHPSVHRQVVVQMAALLAFLSVRSIPESSGAFFGVDWLLLALVFTYLQVINNTLQRTEKTL